MDRGRSTLSEASNRPTLESIFDQMGRSVPLEVGFDPSLNGTRDGVILTSPIPEYRSVNEPIPPMKSTPYFGDVLTKSAIPSFKQNVLVTSQPGMEPGKGMAPAKPIVCEGPGGLCPADANKRLFDILTSKPVEISCACDIWEQYQMSNPTTDDFEWKSGLEFIFREDEESEFEASDTFRLRYSNWGPAEKQEDAPKILFIHDALDSHKSWWCVQKILSPFMDTLAVDLLGSGNSIKPRGLNSASVGTSADPFPWSYRLHADYLLGMVNVFWPNQSLMVVGLGWGAQIAAAMASMSKNISGLIMINPPGFDTKLNYSRPYLDIINLHKVTSDEKLQKMVSSLTSKVRECLFSNINSLGVKGLVADNSSSTIINQILDQYEGLDRKRVLIEQLLTLQLVPFQEFPKTDENPLGLEIDKISAPCCVISSDGDMIYSPSHRNLYPAVYYSSQVETRCIAGTGHFVNISNSKTVAELIIDFAREKLGFGSLADVFIGFSGPAQGNEKAIINGLRDLYKF